MDFAVRKMVLSDAEKIRPLLTELGYPVCCPEIENRFRSLEPSNNGLFVAEIDDLLVGWLHVVKREFLSSSARAEIVGIVVDQGFRKLGIGKALVEQATTWTKQSNLKTLRVTSNLKRNESHVFYRHLGFELTKESAVYHFILDKSSDSKTTLN